MGYNTAIGVDEGTQAFHSYRGWAVGECSDTMRPAESVPCDQIQPKMVVDLGQMTVLAADNLRLQWLRASSICDQLETSS